MKQKKERVWLAENFELLIERYKEYLDDMLRDDDDEIIEQIMSFKEFSQESFIQEYEL